MTIADIAARIVAASWLGHGRRTEALLVIVATIYAFLLLIVPNASEHSQATVDLFWEGYGKYLIYPLVLKALLSGLGLAGNIAGYAISRPLRFAGAIVGFFVWTWFVAKFSLTGAVATPGFVFSLVAALYGELGTIFMATANLPRPGAPGNAGRM